MLIKKIISTQKLPVKKAASKKTSAVKRTPKEPSQKKPRTSKANTTKTKPRKESSSKKETTRLSPIHTLANKTTNERKSSPKCATKKAHSLVAKAEITPKVFNSERMAEHVELAGGSKSSVSIETLKIGLLLAAIDGNCDENEIKKFKTVAKSCGGLSDAKIDQIVSQMQRRISVLEDAAKHGASDEELIDKFMSEASKIGVRADCRNFVLWMSIAMVDGDYSGVEQKAITALQKHANRSQTLSFLSRHDKHEISNIFLKRCQMILSGIYMADSAGDKRLMANRMKSLQMLIEITEA